MQRTIEHQSWRDSLGHKKCGRIEEGVDGFLANFPGWEVYDSQECKQYRNCIGENLKDSVGYPLARRYRFAAESSWEDAIHDLGAEIGGNEDCAIYALRYASNELVLVKRPSLSDYANHYANQCRDFVGKFIPAIRREEARSFADFEF